MIQEYLCSLLPTGRLVKESSFRYLREARERKRKKEKGKRKKEKGKRKKEKGKRKKGIGIGIRNRE